MSHNPFDVTGYLYFPPRKEGSLCPGYGGEQITINNVIQAFSCLVMQHIQLHDAQHRSDVSVAARDVVVDITPGHAGSPILTDEEF